MAACHFRSISLPARSHPLTVTTEEELYKLKASESSSIGHKLSGLKNLFESVNDLLQLRLAHQTLSHDRQSQCAENALNGSLELLDLCESTRDFFSRMKECVQELELSLRRAKGRDCHLTVEVDAYMVSRKKLNKAICKCLRNLKKRERNYTTAVLDAKGKINALWVVRHLKIIANQARLMRSRNGVNEAEKIDAELITLKSSKDICLSQLQNLLKGLEAFESSIQEAEEELECIYRQLVKTRVSLLNILNH
ncbi:hypothetical protein GH714_032458 [Hevea brasiliensis]|uniref:Uncharacterized protein n=1 Tax=Hevea brasiliensis TaxID=3981 RepID=A0A6A6L2X7_HEVBR|nr:hypothetical protein GH714_032458 [Hevea brasiliensis]